MPTMKTAHHNAASLQQIAARFNSLVLRLEAVAKILDAHKIESVEITHQAELLNGLKRVENWGDAVYRCAQRHLEGQGAYQVPVPKCPLRKRGSGERVRFQTVVSVSLGFSGAPCPLHPPAQSTLTLYRQRIKRYV